MQPRSHRALGVTVAGLLLAGLLGGCASSDDTDITDITDVTGTGTADPTAASTPTPEVTAPPAAPVPATTPSPAAPAPTSAPTTSPTPLASPSSATGASVALRSARRDAASIAPQLESYYRDREYPVDLAQVQQTLADSGVRLSSGNSLGGYTYDGDAVEFVLCVENTSGAWATYDTAPMTLQRSGETGGCP